MSHEAVGENQNQSQEVAVDCSSRTEGLEGAGPHFGPWGWVGVIVPPLLVLCLLGVAYFFETQREMQKHYRSYSVLEDWRARIDGGQVSLVNAIESAWRIESMREGKSLPLSTGPFDFEFSFVDVPGWNRGVAPDLWTAFAHAANREHVIQIRDELVRLQPYVAFHNWSRSLEKVVTAAVAIGGAWLLGICLWVGKRVYRPTAVAIVRVILRLTGSAKAHSRSIFAEAKEFDGKASESQRPQNSASKGRNEE